MTAPLPPRYFELRCQRCSDMFTTHDVSRALSSHRRICAACRAGWPEATRPVTVAPQSTPND